MMAKQEPKKIVNWQIGPAFFGVVIAIVVQLVGFAYGYGKLTNQSDTDKSNIQTIISKVETENKEVLQRFEDQRRNISDIIAKITQQQTDRTNGINDRLITVETNVKNMSDNVRAVTDNVKTVDAKVEQLLKNSKN